ncbi:glycosyltransferase family 4 protein [Salinimicrobium sp. CAU 1759]
MKTAILSFSIKNSSLSEYFIEIANGLSKSHHVVIVTDCLQAHPFRICSGIKIVKRPAFGPKNPKVLWFLFSLIKKQKPEILIGNFSSVGPLMIFGFLLRVKTRIAWCHSISRQFLNKRPFFDKKKYVYALATKIFANSMSTKEDLVNNFRIEPRKVEVFYNALRKPKVSNELQMPLQFTFAGRLDESKGVRTLLQAMPSVVTRHPHIQLKIIGGHPDSESVYKWKNLVKELGLEKNVGFLNFQPSRFVLEEFSKSYFALVPSMVEAFGYVVIESFSVKTPVIGSNTTGISEIIRDGTDGYLFEPGNPEDLAAKMIKLLDDPTLREKFSLNCFRRFEEKFELTKVASDLVNRIEILNSGSSK